MIKHIVVFRFRDEALENQRRALLEELRDFPTRFPAIRRWSIGCNISTRDDTFTHAFVAEFAGKEELQQFLASEQHEAFVRDRWRPLIERRAIVTYEHSDSTGPAVC